MSKGAAYSWIGVLCGLLVAGCSRAPQKERRDPAAGSMATQAPAMRPRATARRPPPPRRPRRRAPAFVPDAVLQQKIAAAAKVCPPKKLAGACKAMQGINLWIRKQEPLGYGKPFGPKIQALRTMIHALGSKDPVVRSIGVALLNTDEMAMLPRLDNKPGAIPASDIRILMGSLPHLRKPERQTVVSLMASLAPLKRLTDDAFKALVAAYGVESNDVDVFLWTVLRFYDVPTFDRKRTLALIDQQIPPDPYASGKALSRFESVIKARAEALTGRPMAARQPHCAWLAKVLPPKVPRRVRGFILGASFGTTVAQFVSACRATALIPYLLQLRKRMHEPMTSRYVGLVLKKRALWQPMNVLSKKRAELVAQRAKEPAKAAALQKQIETIDRQLKAYERRLSRMDSKFMSGAF